MSPQPAVSDNRITGTNQFLGRHPIPKVLSGGVALARFGFSLDMVLSLSLCGSTPEKFSL
jgi:hypothetical protein